MIAVWDQVRSDKPGGTSEVVALKLGEDREYGQIGFVGANSSGSGPVHILLARRQSTGPKVPVGPKHEIRYPDGTTAKDFEASYKLLEQFNADVRSSRDKVWEVVASRRALCEGLETSGSTPAMDWVAGVYSWADTLAIEFAARGLLLWKVVFGLLAIGGIALTLLHTVPRLDDDWRLHVIYYLALALAFLLGRWEVRDRHRQRHEDYRALAEALRVQFFWLAAGLRDMASDNYLAKQAGEVVWIRDAMSECMLYNDNVSARNNIGFGDAARLSLALAWVEGQAAYFNKTSVRHQGKYKFLGRVALCLAVAGFFLPLVGWLVPILIGREIPYLKQIAHTLPTIALLWAALIWNYSELRGYIQEARQYDRMYEIFQAARARLRAFERESTPESFAAAESTIRKLGQDALAENGDWLSMHRERKLKAEIAAG